ncbi:MAG: hypothetical protein CV087_17590 [Candidatus Brocadia sp. WS118]|nr:MAG: hypothetical protein CV087_17590 [Candidatus Brocadia sp. WS118]
MAYDGAVFGSRVDNFTYQKIYAKVVDNILSSPTLVSRFMGKAKPFVGKTMDFTVDVTSDTQGQWFNGLETLDAAAVTTTIPLSYAQTNFEQPKVSVMVESFANSGEQQAIPLDVFKYEKAMAQALQALGTAVYGSGTANQMNGLGNIVADSGTIGGQSRSTYSQLDAYVLASGGTMTLAKIAQVIDNVSASGLQSEEPTLLVTDKSTWSLYEQLLNPTVRQEYLSFGYNAMTVRGTRIEKSKDSIPGGIGFNALTFRNFPLIKDDFCTSGSLFALNENYTFYAGRSIVPEDWKGFLEKVNLGTMKAYEGTGAAAMDLPSEYNGWFYQKEMVMPNQAGTIGRVYVIGQLMTNQPRRNGKLTGVTGI